LILKIAMHQIFYKRILVMCLIKKRDLLFYIEELRANKIFMDFFHASISEPNSL
jgi:hypothetical protein